jgi:uncharacterized protein YfaP (DUF2135 family)
MKRFISLLALLSITTMLFACGGGGSSSGSSSTSTDTTAPTVTAFVIPATATSLTVPVTTFTATDDTGVTGYLITTTSTAPAASAAGWSATAPASFAFTASGTYTEYAWAKDAAGNVSLSKSAPVTITSSTPVVAAAVTGVATNPVTGLPLSNATVFAYPQLTSSVAKTTDAAATPVATVTTNANGSYTISGLYTGTTYYFTITATNFATFTYYNIVPSANALTLQNALVIPSSIAGQTATASGHVKNASTNIGLPNMSVQIRSGVNNSTGTVVATSTTDSTGAYSFANLAAGTYTAQVTGNIGTTAIITSYNTLVSIPGTTLNINQDFAVTTPLSSTGSGQYRIVLNWGNNPSDLDSHLTGPTATAGTRFHTWYGSHDYPVGSATIATLTSYPYTSYVAGTTTEAVLDIDNTEHGTNNGPETTTIVVPRSGTYNFYVHHFSGTSNISASGAQVVVYKGSAQLATFNPPAGATGTGDVWSVFTMTVTANGESISPVNTISQISTYSLPKVAAPSFDDYFLFSNLPPK